MQLTEGAKHYGITTQGAASHVHAMIESGEWSDLTGFDRACVAELLAHWVQSGTNVPPEFRATQTSIGTN